MSGDPWFVRRRYLYGWIPYAWQGWVITAAAVAGAITVAVLARAHRSPVWYLAIVGILVVVSVIAAATSGPRPKTQSEADDPGGPRYGNH